MEEEPAPEPEDLLPQVVSPLDGTTVTVFSTTELMYDETMADWRTHNGLDIQAAEGDAVKTGRQRHGGVDQERRAHGNHRGHRARRRLHHPV